MSFGEKILKGDVSKLLVFLIQLLCDVLIAKETKETTEEEVWCLSPAVSECWLVLKGRLTQMTKNENKNTCSFTSGEWASSFVESSLTDSLVLFAHILRCLSLKFLFPPQYNEDAEPKSNVAMFGVQCLADTLTWGWPALPAEPQPTQHCFMLLSTPGPVNGMQHS